MMHDPFTDVFHFLTGSAQDFNPFGGVRYLLVGFYLAVLAVSAYVAAANWRRDAQQRSLQHVSIWLMRVIAAGMWYQGTIWKLPLPVSDGFSYWTGALAKFTAFAPHAALVNAVFIPGIAVIQPLVYLTEIAFTVALTLGLFTRAASLIAVLFTAHLWIGLYNDPTEWPWTYIAIIYGHGMFAACAAGRSLGLDHLWRIAPPRLLQSRPALMRLFTLAG